MTKHKGAHGEIVATAYLLEQGYEVYRNVSQHGAADLIGLKDGKVELFDVKTPSHVTRLSTEQRQLGVRLLIVTGRGCTIK